MASGHSEVLQASLKAVAVNREIPPWSSYKGRQAMIRLRDSYPTHKQRDRKISITSKGPEGRKVLQDTTFIQFRVVLGRNFEPRKL